MTVSSDEPVTVRRADTADLDAVVEVLVESHVEYSWERWALPWTDRRERLRALYRSDVALLGLQHGEVWVTDGLTATAVWLPSAVHRTLSSHEVVEIETAAVAAFGDRLRLVDDVERDIGRHRPAADWHLATMGTRPSMQRRGLGTAVLRHRLAALDQQRETATLETSDPLNVEFYSRLGFVVVRRLDRLQHGAPTTWIMVRSPGGSEHSTVCADRSATERR